MSTKYSLFTKSQVVFPQLEKLGTPLFTQRQLKLVINRLAKDVSRDLTGPLECVVLMNGAYQLVVDLTRTLSIPVILNFVKVSRYSKDSPGILDPNQLNQLTLISDSPQVLILDEVYDEGLTLTSVLNTLQLRYPDRQYKTFALLVKDRNHVYIPDYVGLTIRPDLYLFGYGMDLDNQWRHLPEVWVKKLT